MHILYFLNSQQHNLLNTKLLSKSIKQLILSAETARLSKSLQHSIHN